MNLKNSLILATILFLTGITAWEMYWRSQGYYPTLNDDKDLWSEHRKKVDDAQKNDIVIFGSSRAYFDFQVKTFENFYGKAPIQLAIPGTSPLPTFHDLVNNTNFTGTVIIGVTPGLFFSTTYPKASPWSRGQNKVDYYFDKTHAQWLNYQLSIPLQQNFVFMSADEEEWDDDIDLKSLLRRIRLKSRLGKDPAPPFYYFGDVNLDRNMSMAQKTATDTPFANSVIRVWKFFGSLAPPPDKKSTTEFFLKDLEAFKAKGGKAILVRCPSSGGLRAAENKFLPRNEFWDQLVELSKVDSYHFEDYPQLKELTCPEESHLSKEDAEYFTLEMLKIMKHDGALTNLKTN